MEEKSTLARPYALAAFKQAEEEGKLETWSEMLDFLKSVTADPVMAGLVRDPRVETSRLAGLVLDICQGRLTETGENFVRVLVENRRLDIVGEIANVFERQRAESEGRRQVDVLSAYQLNAKQKKAIADSMKERLGRDVELQVKVDKSLIGGAVVRAGDVVLDLSLRGRLRQLAVQLD